GLRRDEGGRPVPRNMLRSFEARANNEPVFGASFANGTATNPALGFHLRIERSVALSFVRPRGDDTTFRGRRRSGCPDAMAARRHGRVPTWARAALPEDTAGMPRLDPREVARRRRSWRWQGPARVRSGGCGNQPGPNGSGRTPAPGRGACRRWNRSRLPPARPRAVCAKAGTEALRLRTPGPGRTIARDPAPSMLARSFRERPGARGGAIVAA
ncbi:MAG: thiosulfate oxidation carrier complex protein SoxZ, partial [Alphaproteobacteria bacterium]|nr:thiosulfate oxidation carrier complex protein SoxZ [Alphaproteobacteria bacterium]